MSPPCVCLSVCTSLHVYVPSCAFPFVCMFIQVYVMTLHVHFPSVRMSPPCMSPLCVCPLQCMSSPHLYPLRVYVPSVWCPFRVYFSLFGCSFMCMLPLCTSLRVYVTLCTCPSRCIFPLYVCPSVCMFFRMIVVGIRTPRTTGWCGVNKLTFVPTSVWAFGCVQWSTEARVSMRCGQWGTRAQVLAHVSWVVWEHLFFCHLCVSLVVIPCPSPLLSSVASPLTPDETKHEG